jgi:hypothetical protein
VESGKRRTTCRRSRRGSQVDDVFRPALRWDRVVLVAVARARFPIGHALVDLHGIISHLLVLAGFRDQGIGTAFVEEAGA